MKRLSSAWRLTILAFCSGFILAGCGLSGSGSDAKVASKRDSVTSPRPSPPEWVPTRRFPETAREQRSPQQVAALHRVDQAKVLMAAGNFVGAISHLEKTLAIDSTNPHTYFQLARAHHGLGNFRESLNFLEVAESLFGDENGPLIEVWVLKGDNLRGLGQLPQARRSYERALAIDPKNEKAARRLRLDRRSEIRGRTFLNSGL